MPPSSILAIEAAIARAHRSVGVAASYASTLSDLGLHDDLQLIQLELERLQVDLLKGAGKRRALLTSDRHGMYPRSRREERD